MGQVVAPSLTSVSSLEVREMSCELLLKAFAVTVSRLNVDGILDK